MGLFSFFEKRNNESVNDTYTMERLIPDDIFAVNKVTEDNVLKIPSAKACIDIISDTVASLPIKLYKEHKDGSVEPILVDERLKLLNEEPNDFTKGHDLKKHMAKDYILHGASYVAKVEAGNKILELHPLDARDIVIKKRIQNGYRTVGADIVLSISESGAINEMNKHEVKFKPYELVIATNDSKDGLIGRGVIIHGEEIFKEALAQMKYAKNFYERAGLPIGLLKVNRRLSSEQAKTIRDEWRKLYGGVQNANDTAVLQEGMEYQPLSPQTLDIDTSKISTEICKVFNVPYGLISSADGKQHQSLEQNNSVFLANCLLPVLVALETAINKSMLLESEKDKGYFFRFDTSEVVRATESERVKTAVDAIQGSLLTINEARSKFDLPNLSKDKLLMHSGAQVMNPDTGEIESQSNNYKTENSEDNSILPESEEQLNE
ncbi:phage portal protein [Bacillus sp. B3-WWTP-C-10-D-3]|uniref:phage portal protein n=1 Tax=Bacillus sp. B3-WWTP-C-10-D-3 TaxID=2653217 RepID=UPI001262518E|nr:phage portal protein [Bacillus sp. B3-WWTP-C-10-D-3]KAB7640280.1 phage portal protein [Bacillus sp. B3-WWTP-C-10-D-3]